MTHGGEKGMKSDLSNRQVHVLRDGGGGRGEGGGGGEEGSDCKGERCVPVTSPD